MVWGKLFRFAGYDGIVITGKANSLFYIAITDERVEIRDTKKFKEMHTDVFDKKILEELRGRRYKTVYIRCAGENLFR